MNIIRVRTHLLSQDTPAAHPVTMEVRPSSTFVRIHSGRHACQLIGKGRDVFVVSFYHCVSIAETFWGDAE